MSKRRTGVKRRRKKGRESKREGGVKGGMNVEKRRKRNERKEREK